MAGIYSQGGSAGHRYAGWLEQVEAKNFQFGGKVFNGSPSAIYVGSNLVWAASPYSEAATAVLKAAFPTQWKIIFDYGRSHPELVEYVNNDPMRWGAGIASGRSVSLSSTVWKVSEDRTNPDAEHYWGLYESARRKISNAWDVVTIKVKGKAGQFKILIDSYAEGNYDYALASELDATTFNVSNFKANTKSNNKPSTAIANYVEVTYNIPDAEEHTIQVAYRTDGGAWPNDDRAYLLIPAEYGVVDSVALINQTIPPSTP